MFFFVVFFLTGVGLVVVWCDGFSFGSSRVSPVISVLMPKNELVFFTNAIIAACFNRDARLCVCNWCIALTAKSIELYVTTRRARDLRMTSSRFNVGDGWMILGILHVSTTDAIARGSFCSHFCIILQCFAFCKNNLLG